MNVYVYTIYALEFKCFLLILTRQNLHCYPVESSGGTAMQPNQEIILYIAGYSLADQPQTLILSGVAILLSHWSKLPDTEVL